MKKLGITAKIWLSFGVFILGFVFSNVLGILHGLSTEQDLRNAAGSLFPAAQRSQEAQFAFERAVKGFGDAVLVQDASALERAGHDGELVVSALKSVSALSGVPPKKSEAVRTLAASIDQLLTEAKSTYSAFLSNPANMSADVQEKVRQLAPRMEAAKASLQENKDAFSKQLQTELRNVETRSAQQRTTAMIVFLCTIVLASIVVTVTIRRVVTGPVLRVIKGVRSAADKAGSASEQMMQSGQTVAGDAQEQAACIEETSASLEEISTTTNENAERARNADALMRQARETVEMATKTMTALTASMDVVAKSSQEVSQVLKSIDEIAFHTNMLALNAAVEAARAGEAGVGFSVVADEVRSLAQRAADAARRTAEIIERTISDVNTGVHLVSQAQTAFNQVSHTIIDGSDVISQIASSSEEQARGVGHVSEAISRIESVTQRNAENAHQTAKAAEAMTSEVRVTRQHLEELIGIVGR
jgi:transcriptional regulator